MPKEAPPDAFGRVAREYELGRPEWPAELIDRAVGELGLGAEAVVLDLGAGTGKLTRALVPRFARVFAVEPDDAMRAVLEEVVEDAEALAGSAEAIPLEDQTVDAVFSAEAFHWFASDETVGEIARVLKPRGGLVILWNLESGQLEPPVDDAARALLDDAFARGGAPGIGKVRAGGWREPLARSAFEPLREAELERTVSVTREQFVAWVLSVSSIASQPDEDRGVLAAGLRELVPEQEFRSTMRVVAYWTRLAG